LIIRSIPGGGIVSHHRRSAVVPADHSTIQLRI
jgi:hypothetical protein